MKPPRSPSSNPELWAGLFEQGRPVLAQLGEMLVNSAAYKSAPGYQRGIDYYSAAKLPGVIANDANQFRGAHNRNPELLRPTLLSDKIFRSKYFRAMRVPETGNKLLASSFIPADARDLVSCPEIVWHSPTPRVPRGDEVEPGTYYLKTNHGADMYRRLTYPIGESEAEALDREFAAHLKNPYGLTLGEWWYNAFRPQLLLEKAIGTAELTTSWNYYVIGGEIALLVIYQKIGKPTEYRKSYLTPEFEPLAEDTPEPARFTLPSRAARDRMKAAALAIGGKLGFVRVDFLLDDDDRPFLGEVTFTPGSGTTKLSPALDARLGAMWAG